MRISFFNTIFCNTTIYAYRICLSYMLVKCFIQLQFCLDEADKPQVMFYFPEYVNVEDITHLKGVLQFR